MGSHITAWTGICLLSAVLSSGCGAADDSELGGPHADGDALDDADLTLDNDPGLEGYGRNGYCGTALTGVVRDFRDAHPDFEFMIEKDPGIVRPELGDDGKPVYAGQQGNPTTNGAAAFDEWYRTVDGVNRELPFTIELREGAGGIHTYENGEFFPVDDAGFGNEGRVHNYHFTFELRTRFHYRGGEVFTFTGDDDLFTFVNGRLAIDLGGVHGAMTRSLDLDEQAGALGLEPGHTYTLDLFFAERHTSQSRFRIDTTLAFVDCGDAPK